MDLKLTYSWIKEHLKTRATAYEFAKYLSLCGPSIERVTKLNKDHLLHIEVTTNRVDMASVMGLAREASVILPRFGLKAQLVTPITKKYKATTPKEIIIKDDNELSLRTIGVVLEQITNWTTPEWMKDRLEVSGIRSLNAPVDITNYVMLEVGHPLHVFDFDSIKNHQIIIDESKKGEKIIGLDEQTYTLSGGDVIFRDVTGKIIDLPGIMGTQNSVVRPHQTTGFLLFSDDVTPQRIRKTSMELGLRTVAAQYNEKGVDPELGMLAVKRALDLFITICKPKAVGQIVDHYHNPIKPQTISITPEFVSQKLGVAVTALEIQKIMEQLGFIVKKNRGGVFQITPPSYRANDIQIPEDIVEEVARIYGYHQIEGVLMEGLLPVNPNPTFNFEWNIKNRLVNLGGIEVYTSSLVASSEMVDKKGVILSNPMGSDTEYLRDNLTTSIQKVLANNTKKQPKLFVFEMANIYLPVKGDLPEEKNTLALGFTGYTFPDAVEMVKVFLAKIGVRSATQPTISGLNFLVGKNTIGEINLLDQHMIANFSVTALHTHAKTVAYQPANSNPPQIEDLKFEVAPQVYLGQVIEEMEKIPFVANVELLDRFDQFVTFRIYYQSPNKTLTDKEVARIRQKLTDVLSTQFAFKYQA